MILTEQLPIFDYDATFEGYFSGATLASVVNDKAESQKGGRGVLVPVRVGGEAYTLSRTAAMKALREGRAGVPESLVGEIVDELSAFEYQWAPSLDECANDNSADELQLTRFTLGYFLFSTYAHQLEGVHLAQGKRARLQLGASLRAPSASLHVEGELYERLRKAANELKDVLRIEYEIPEAPTFLPTLLRDDPKTPHELLRNALRLRNSGEIADYRAFRSSALTQLDGGERPIDALKTLSELATKVRKVLVPDSIKVETAVTLSPAGFAPSVKASTPAIPVGWLFDGLPGRRHRKLLTRAWADAARFSSLEQRLRTLWDDAPAS